MKKSLLIAVFLLPAFVFAGAKKERNPQTYIPGSKCGLMDSWGELDSSSTTFDISRSTKRVNQLPNIVKKQLIAAANMSLTPPTSDAKVAAAYLRDSSEGYELYVLRTEHRSKKFSVISYYGGGNHTGVIFPWGSDKPLAEIGDDDINCIK